MNRSIAEANMSIDDSLTILNGALNTFNDEQPHLTDKQEIENELDFSSKIEQSIVSAEPRNLPNDDLNKEIIQRNAVELVDCEIDFAKQKVVNQLAQCQADPKEGAAQKIVLSIQQIVHQPKQNDSEAMQQAGIIEKTQSQPAEQHQAMERNATVQKLLFVAQNDQTKSAANNSRSANESAKQSTAATNHNNEVEMNADESLRLNDSQANLAKVNLSTKSSHEVDMSVDDSLVLNDIRNIFETSTSSSEFLITKPLKKIETPKRLKNRESEMDVSCSENDSLILKEIKIENNPIDCLDESPYLKSLPPPKQVFKLSRKRLNCETESPIKKSSLSSNLFKSHFNTTPLISANKKWRSATYNPMTSSPKKMELVSPLKPIDSNIICSSINSGTIDNLLISNLNMMIQKSDQLPNLMGDYSSTYALPLISGRHKDLKTISPETLAKLIKGDYQKSISHFTIVDSRYPYEYEAGHIDGSKNIYHKEEINKYFFGTDKPTLITDKALIDSAILGNFKQSSSNSMRRAELKNSNFNRNSSSKRLSVIKEGENDENNLLKVETTNEPSQPVADAAADSQSKRHAIIFHCEFSSERGPSMCRHLRKIDRELNENCYPNLHYPEIYLLHGGYKLFFEKFKSLCYPQIYLPMHSADHKQDLIKFRTKSKTWNCERKSKFVSN